MNLLDSLIFRGYEVDTLLSTILKSSSSKLAGLTAAVHNPFSLNGRGDMLPASSPKAIEILNKNPKGFFLIIDGSQIDWAGHANYADTLIDKTPDFDKAVGKVLNFAQKEGDTLGIYCHHTHQAKQSMNPFMIKYHTQPQQQILHAYNFCSRMLQIMLAHYSHDLEIIFFLSLRLIIQTTSVNI